MLDHWGYRYFTIGMTISYAEVSLEAYFRLNRGLSTGRDVALDPKHAAFCDLRDRCNTILQLADDDAELGAIPQNVQRLIVKLAAAASPHNPVTPLYLDEALEDIERIKTDFSYVLSQRRFYAISPELLKFYGHPQLFGERVAKKFPAACDDIERAGNCLALGEPTACVLHLNRAMEIALHRLARKLGVTPLATDNMGSILGKMTDPIKNMPDKTEAQKRKKERWAECRTNLYHVKMAWRDPGSHGKQSYDEKRAHDIIKRVDDFMQQLATLL
jgi:hypothetical protein